MKDAYSFSEDEKDLDIIYDKMHKAYSRIVERLGLKFRVVEADTGLIGGKSSHEFLVLAGDGEETLIYCPDCGYAANMELASSVCPEVEPGSEEEIQEVATPGVTDIDSLADFMKVKKNQTVKTMLLEDEEKNIYAFMMAGDRELNVNKAEKFLKKPLRLFDGENKSLAIGFVGPVGLDSKIKIYADNSLKNIKNIVTGANKKDTHLKNVSMERDAEIASYGDFTFPCENDSCPKCGSSLNTEKGIEIGHIFKLGKKYSQKMEAQFLGRDGKLKPFVMGCYGIGITRIMSAVIEQLHDEKGIIWPASIAPYAVSLVVTTSKSEEMADAGEKIYNELLENQVEVLYDDRKISAGIKFKDSDLLGLPIRMVVGKKYLEKKLVEVQLRSTGEITDMPPEKLAGFVKDFLAENIIG
jgi:prolyl-tRNA synthetase